MRRYARHGASAAMLSAQIERVWQSYLYVYGARLGLEATAALGRCSGALQRGTSDARAGPGQRHNRPTTPCRLNHEYMPQTDWGLLGAPAEG